MTARRLRALDPRLDPSRGVDPFVHRLRGEPLRLPAARIRRPEDVSPGEADECGLGGLQRQREEEPVDRYVRDVTRDIGDPTPEITEQIGKDGLGQQEGLLMPRIVLDHTKSQAPRPTCNAWGAFRQY